MKQGRYTVLRGRKPLKRPKLGRGELRWFSPCTHPHAIETADDAAHGRTQVAHTAPSLPIPEGAGLGEQARGARPSLHSDLNISRTRCSGRRGFPTQKCCFGVFSCFSGGLGLWVKEIVLRHEGESYNDEGEEGGP